MHSSNISRARQSGNCFPSRYQNKIKCNHRTAIDPDHKIKSSMILRLQRTMSFYEHQPPSSLTDKRFGQHDCNPTWREQPRSYRIFSGEILEIALVGSEIRGFVNTQRINTEFFVQDAESSHMSNCHTLYIRPRISHPGNSISTPIDSMTRCYVQDTLQSNRVTAETRACNVHKYLQEPPSQRSYRQNYGLQQSTSP